MGTSDSYVYQGRPRRSSRHRSLTADDPASDRNVAKYADACIESLRRPQQRSNRVRPVEPIAEAVSTRAADIGSRLAAVASRRPETVFEPTESKRVVELVLDEVFGDVEHGSDRIEALLRECAARAVSRWLQHEHIDDSLEEPGFDEILVDPLGAVAPELVEDADGTQVLLDEFHAELLVELVQMVAGEGMFPGLTLVKLLWALYRWASDRILRTRSSESDRERASMSAKDRERAVIDELLDLDEPANDGEGGIRR